MKKLNALLLVVVGVTTLHAAKLDQVIVRQQWPWSTDIKVEYRLSETDAEHPVDLALKVYNGDVELPLPETAITGDRYGISDVVGTIIIDPVKAFGTEKVALANFKVKLTVMDSPAFVTGVLYRVFDLDSGNSEDVTAADILNGKRGSFIADYSQVGSGYNTSLTNVLIWTEVTNDVYKTSKLVMRYIPAKDEVWQIGSPTDEPGRAVQDSETQRYVKLSQDFFIGVFPITQAQWAKIASANTGANPSTFTSDPDALVHPVNNVSYSMLRGNLTYKGPHGELVNWPTNSVLHDVVTESGRASFLKDLRVLCKGVEFDLPFDPQWEFACRAGTTQSLNDGLGLLSGAETSPRLDALGWYKDNSDSKTHAVGLKRPNAFGLYDMHGNVAELLANWVGDVGNATSGTGDTASDPLVDPLGVVNTSGTRESRGGFYDSLPSNCRSASRRATWTAYYTRDPAYGFRVVCPVGTVWQ